LKARIFQLFLAHFHKIVLFFITYASIAPTSIFSIYF